jgi:hypothetical protein
MKRIMQYATRNTFSIVLALGLALALVGGIATALGAQAQDTGPQGPLSPQADMLGTGFTYQGRLIDNGAPVDGVTCTFTFELYESASGGGTLDTYSDTAEVSDGYFSVLLDFGSDTFEGEARWLEVSVQCPGDSAPVPLDDQRVALSAAPYALYALGAPWSGLTGIPGDLNDGDDDTTYAAGTGLELASGAFSITPTYRLPQACANGQIAEWNDTTSLWECGDDDSGAGGSYWSLIGNSGTNPGTHFLGTTDNVSLTLAVSGTAALRIEPNADSPNLIAGHSSNSVTGGAYGATIGGGGRNGVANHAGSNATVGGGYGNTASGFGATIGGGYGNTASGQSATVSGGTENTASGNNGTVGGGWSNTASDTVDTVGGGWSNTASGGWSTVGGGESNLVTATHATIAGGYNITVTGDYAAVPGGANNAAPGDYSFAVGRGGNANHNGAFVWGDSTDADINSPAADTFIVRANGGIWFGATTVDFTPSISSTAFISTSTGAYLSTGGEWKNSSDRNKKENFEPVDGQDVLARLAEIPITTWNFKAEDPSVRHLGPMAQDFYAAFGLGDSDTSIGTLDADGVALAAIQALHEQNQDLQAENAELRGRVDDLEARLSALEEQVNGEAAPSPTSSRFLPSGWAGLLALATVAGVWAWRRG